MTAIEMVTIDCADPGRLAEFWTAVLGTKIQDDMDGEYLILAPSREGGIALALQRVPEPTSGKNRLHLDLHATDRRAEVSRLTELGATVVEDHEQPGFAWTVLADPEGNVFCVGGPEPS